MLSGLSEQRHDLIGSPRALYEEGVVQPLVFTIIPPSQRAWWAQFDNTGTLESRWQFGKCHISQGRLKMVKMATEEMEWGKF